jgi:hypothetical protein
MKAIVSAATVVLASTAAWAQDKPQPVTLGALIQQGYDVRGISMPDHHAVNFIAQRERTVYWCHGTNFGQVLLGKASAIETQCFLVK